MHYIGSPPGVCQSTQRQVVEEVARLNGILANEQHDPEIATRIAQYEMAFRMQASVPELTDFSGETQETLDLYGVKEPGDGSFASNCLLARRLAERGVRMIQLYHRAWDHHSNIEPGMKEGAGAGGRPSAALMEELARRGLLDQPHRDLVAQGHGRALPRGVLGPRRQGERDRPARPGRGQGPQRRLRRRA